MKNIFVALGAASALCLAARAQTVEPAIPAGKIAVLKGGTSDNAWPMITSRVAPVFVQVFDPIATNQLSPLLSIGMATNSTVPGSLWINHHAGSEGGGISRSTDRRILVMEGYTGDILSPTAAKPSTDGLVSRGIVTLDAFTNATSVYSDYVNWFGVPVGSALGTQDNPTGIASTDGTNFWGTGNFAGISTELDGTLFYNPGQNFGMPVEVQNYIQAAAEARVIGGTLYIAVLSGAGITGGIYNFVDPASQAVVPLPYDPDVPNPYLTTTFPNLYLNWGNPSSKIANFDMDAANTVAYGADQTYGIVKFTNNAGVWQPAPYFFSSTNLGTLNQASANQGCFGICVDFSGANPVIYATTMENGFPIVNSKAGHQNQNRLIRFVDNGTDPGTNVVAETLAIATTTNEFFGGVDFTPDLTPQITASPSNYATTNGGSASFSVTANAAFAMTYQWLENTSVLGYGAGPTVTLTNLSTSENGFSYRCIVTDQYGSVTSAPAILTVTGSAVPPVITSGTNAVVGYVDGAVVFPGVTARGTQPFSYQWYAGTQMLVDDGVKYSGSTSSSLSISNLTIADSLNYYVVVMNSAGFASNLVDVLNVKYHPATINAGEPQSVTTFVGLSTSITADQTGGTPPVSFQWYRGTNALTDNNEFSGTGTATLTISPAGLGDNGTNYYIVASNQAGSVTSAVASVAVLVPPPFSSVSYSNQLYVQNFDSLPDPGVTSVNSINNPLDAGTINGVAYSLSNPFDFNYPIIVNSYVGGLGSSKMQGWYGAADTITNVTTPDGISRFGAQDGDQSTGGVIDYGLDDVNGGVVGTNRSLGLQTTSTTGSTTFALKLVNTSGTELNYINLSFVGELWRQNSGARTMTLGYTFDNTATNFTLTSESITNCTLVPGLSFSFPTNITLNVMDGTQSSNQVNLATNDMALASSWQPGAALWLVWSMDYYGTGGGNGYAIDNLNFSATSGTLGTPSSTTASASKITASSAQLNGTISPGNSASGYWFDYGTTASYGKSSPTNILGFVSGSGSASAVITGLLPGTTYHYTILATNLAGMTVPTDVSFTTLAVSAPELVGTAYNAGTLTFTFTNATGASFSVLGTNIITAPLTNWPVVGHPTENPAGSGNYKVSITPGSKAAQFYILRQP